MKVVKSVVDKCLQCRRFNARSGQQIMSELPVSRVDTSAGNPFNVVGADVCGPFKVKVKRSSVKRYVVIFACHSSRAIHCEVLHSLTADSFINSCRRLMSRRGKVERFVMDQGTNFRGAERQLSEALREWNSTEIGQKLHQVGSEFTFLPPKSSSQNGATERAVRLFRSHFRHVADQQSLDDETFETLVIECEGILNCRPLVATTDDIEDCRALTPNDLLQVRPSSGLPPGVFDDNLGQVRFRRQWRQVQCLANSFWHRFRKEYLPTLQRRQKWLVPRRNFQVGDLVLVNEEPLPRSVWKLARIVKVYVSDDGKVRSAQIRMSNGHLFDRPITKLYLLEGQEG